MGLKQFKEQAKNKKLTMKNNLYKAALAAALGLAGATAAQAQINTDDLILGFTSQFSGVTQDYLVDLGQVPTGGNILANNNTALNVSGFNGTTFGGIFNSALSANAVNVGIVASKAGSSGNDIFSELDNGSGTYSLTGSATPPTDTKSALQSGASIPGSLTLGAVNQSASGSFFQLVAENPNTAGAAANSFAGYVDNPLSTVGGSETIVLDLWEDAYNLGGPGSWVYDGNVTIDVSGDNLSAVYDVTPAPEPTTYAIFGGLGVLLLGMRRQSRSKSA
jgi:hypothetical protein